MTGAKLNLISTMGLSKPCGNHYSATMNLEKHSPAMVVLSTVQLHPLGPGTQVKVRTVPQSASNPEVRRNTHDIIQTPDIMQLPEGLVPPRVPHPTHRRRRAPWPTVRCTEASNESPPE
ncbi:hypothetical protein PspLS_00271 [Pyricularia sp. CBS 133598]|nr:hypothetical protein PspLS_00271 [Pyricularia sp. CBS 133598]